MGRCLNLYTVYGKKESGDGVLVISGYRSGHNVNVKTLQVLQGKSALEDN